MNDLKGVLRLTTVMFLFIGFFGLLAYAEETQEQQVERLIRELQDEDSSVRAAGSLVQIGKDAVPALIQALQDQHAEGFARMHAAEALWQIGTPEGIKATVPVVIQALQDLDADVRRHALIALGNIGERAKDAVPILVLTLQDQDKVVRHGAAWALGRMGKDAVPALIQALQGTEVYLRVCAASALGNIGEGAKDAVPILIQSLQDQNKDVHGTSA